MCMCVVYVYIHTTYMYINTVEGHELKHSKVSYIQRSLVVTVTEKEKGTIWGLQRLLVPVHRYRVIHKFFLNKSFIGETNKFFYIS